MSYGDKAASIHCIILKFSYNEATSKALCKSGISPVEAHSLESSRRHDGSSSKGIGASATVTTGGAEKELWIGALCKVVACGAVDRTPTSQEGIVTSRDRCRRRGNKVDGKIAADAQLQSWIEARKVKGVKGRLQSALDGGTETARGCLILRVIPANGHECRAGCNEQDG